MIKLHNFFFSVDISEPSVNPIFNAGKKTKANKRLMYCILSDHSSAASIDLN